MDCHLNPEQCMSENTRQAEWMTSLATVSATLAYELTQPLTVVRLAVQNALAELGKWVS